MDDNKMAEKLWELANLVTGFAVAQSLVVTFAMAKGEWNISLTGDLAHWVAGSATVVFTVLYVVAILWCNKAARKLTAENADLWRIVTGGRLCTVLLFTLVTLGTLVGHARNQLQGPPVEQRPHHIQ